ncbi:uncharacterized protein STEHIDRAFT_69223 [Stereum hirsutum FP-91666 SS1]|uniref:C2H2-type domain-containing protein n=1 Tax=Stereum hirsutum (strain FP-91666) TaxID=721885 RepID=R7RXT9_STEHR|nr:uncharacterized protein STEHIDRAFT_69223 [Stereum hirsutum FP-91666 SS1]EIM79710.1 hypothetical protein STEHIDRAFT_69223 [Stereum hirsutum FP-91666 SS1]
MFFCISCHETFPDETSLHTHCRDKENHHYCKRCKRLFHTRAILQEHIRTAAVHQQYAYTCNTSRLIDSSVKSLNDPEDPSCFACETHFSSMRILYRHLANRSSHHWCFVCYRDFETSHILEEHVSSYEDNEHVLECPICAKTFATPSCMADHIEYDGACHYSGRNQVRQSSTACPPKVKSYRSSTSRLNDVASSVHADYVNNARPFNGDSYQCYLCHRTFRTLKGLHSHLESLAHDRRDLRCPKCKAWFSTASSLTDHIEKELRGVGEVW